MSRSTRRQLLPTGYVGPESMQRGLLRQDRQYTLALSPFPLVAHTTWAHAM